MVQYGAGDYYVHDRFKCYYYTACHPLPQPMYNQPPLLITPIANVSADAISSGSLALISQPPAVASVVAPSAQTVTPPVPDVSQLFQGLIAAGSISHIYMHNMHSQ